MNDAATIPSSQAQTTSRATAPSISRKSRKNKSNKRTSLDIDGKEEMEKKYAAMKPLISEADVNKMIREDFAAKHQARPTEFKSDNVNQISETEVNVNNNNMTNETRTDIGTLTLKESTAPRGLSPKKHVKMTDARIISQHKGVNCSEESETKVTRSYSDAVRQSSGRGVPTLVTWDDGDCGKERDTTASGIGPRSQLTGPSSTGTEGRPWYSYRFGDSLGLASTTVESSGYDTSSDSDVSLGDSASDINRKCSRKRRPAHGINKRPPGGRSSASPEAGPSVMSHVHNFFNGISKVFKASFGSKQSDTRSSGGPRRRRRRPRPIIKPRAAGWSKCSLEEKRLLASYGVTEPLAEELSRKKKRDIQSPSSTESSTDAESDGDGTNQRPTYRPPGQTGLPATTAQRGLHISPIKVEVSEQAFPHINDSDSEDICGGWEHRPIGLTEQELAAEQQRPKQQGYWLPDEEQGGTAQTLSGPSEDESESKHNNAKTTTASVLSFHGDVHPMEMIINTISSITAMAWWGMVSLWLIITTAIGLWLDFSNKWIVLLLWALYGAYTQTKAEYDLALHGKKKRRSQKKLAATRRTGFFKKTKLKPTKGIRNLYKVKKGSGKVGRHKSNKIVPIGELYAQRARPGELGPFKVSEERGFVKLDINGIRKHALVDTGASPSCISLDVWDQLKRESNTRLPFESSECVAYNFLGQSSEVVGQTILQLGIGGEDGRGVDIDNVPFLIVPSNDDKVIIGQNILKSMRVTIGYDDDEVMFLQFKNPAVKVRATYADNEGHQLVSLAEVVVPPKQTRVIDALMAASPGKRTNLDNQPVYVYNDSLDDPGVVDSISQLRRGKVQVTVHNASSCPLTLPPHAPVATFNVLDATNSSHVDAVAEISDRPQRERITNCLCKYGSDVGVLLLSDEVGNTTLGYEVTWPEGDYVVKLVESHNHGDWELTQIGRNKFVLRIAAGATQSGLSRKGVVSDWARDFSQIKLVCDKPERMTRNVLAYAAWLNKTAPNVSVDLEPLTRDADEGKFPHCECRSRRLASRYTITETRHYSKLCIHILNTAANIDGGPWTYQVEGSNTFKFNIMGIIMECYPISNSKFGVAVHGSFDKRGNFAAVMRELLVQLKPLFPKANVVVSINQSKSTINELPIQQMGSLFKESADWLSYWNAFQSEPKERPKVIEKPRKMRLLGCECTFCNSANPSLKTTEAAILFSAKWPSRPGEVDVEALEKERKRCLPVDLIGVKKVDELARHNGESFEAVKENMDFLDRIGEPLGYDSNWINSKDYPIKEIKEPSNWRKAVDMSEIPEAAHEGVSRLFDKYESVLSSAKEDYRPIKHVRLSLIPKDKTPFSTKPYPCPPHLEGQMAEIVRGMELKGWCIEGQRPTFVSSSFLVKKNAQNFRTADMDAKRVPYNPTPSGATLLIQNNT